MLFLTNSNETIQVTLSESISTDLTAGWIDHSDSGALPGSAQINVASSGDVELVPAPSSGEQRQVKFISIKNKYTGSPGIPQTVIVQKYNNTDFFELTSTISLPPNATLVYIDSIGFVVTNEAGQDVSSGGTGTVTEIDVTPPSEGLNITGAPITDQGNLVFTLDDDLEAVEGLGTTGLAVRTAASTWATRTITGAGTISVTDGDGVSGNPVVSTTPVAYTEAEGLTSTTGTAFLQKVRLTFTADTGDYLLHFYAEVRSVDSGTRVVTRVQENDTTTHHESDLNPDANQGIGFGVISGFKQISFTAGSQNIDLDFASSQAGKQVSIRRARLYAMRIA